MERPMTVAVLKRILRAYDPDRVVYVWDDRGYDWVPVQGVYVEEGNKLVISEGLPPRTEEEDK